MGIRQIWTSILLSFIMMASFSMGVNAQELGSGVVIGDGRLDAILLSTNLRTYKVAHEDILDPVGVAVDETGIVYALSRGSGELLRLIPEEKPRVILRNLNEPRALILSEDGLLYVSAGTSVFSITTTGESGETLVSGLVAPDTIALWSPPGATSGMLVGTNGAVKSIIVVPSDGSPIRTLAEGFDFIGGIGAVPGRAEFYVTDTGRNEIIAIDPLKDERRVIQDGFQNPGAIAIFPALTLETESGFSVGVSLGSDIVALNPGTGTGIDIGTAINAIAIAAVPELTHPGVITGEVPLGTARPIVEPEPEPKPEPKSESVVGPAPPAFHSSRTAVFGGLGAVVVLGFMFAAIMGAINAFLRRPLDVTDGMPDETLQDVAKKSLTPSMREDSCAELRDKVKSARKLVDQIKPNTKKANEIAELAQQEAQEASEHLTDETDQAAYEANVLKLRELTQRAGEAAQVARTELEAQEGIEMLEKRAAALLIRCEIANRAKVDKNKVVTAVPAKPLSATFPENKRCCPSGTWLAYGWTSSGTFMIGKETTQVTFICLEDPSCSVTFAWESLRIGLAFGGENSAIGGIAVNVCGSGEIEQLLEGVIFGAQADVAIGLSFPDAWKMRKISKEGREALRVLRRLGRQEAKSREAIWHVSDIKDTVRKTLASQLRHDSLEEKPALKLFPLGPSIQVGVWKRIKPELYFVDRSGDCN